MTEHKISLKLMGSLFELIVVHKDPSQAENLLNEGVLEIKRIETLLTEFSNTSITSLINANAGIQPVEVPDEVFQLIKRAQHISKITQGSFDITVSPLKKLYNFKNNNFNFPDHKKIRDTLKIIGFNELELLNGNKVFLKKKGMRISFAAIGKGYAADRVRKLWQEKNVYGGAVNASGDLAVFGKHADGSQWKIGIANPDNKEELLFSIPILNGAVATSGDYVQYFMKGGIRYSHTIHPKTGLPLTGIKSVSIIHPSAELCDALATAVYVMGIEVGLHFINQLPETHAIIINAENKVFLSDHINLENATF
ncbi:MAG: FAD:protein transferase [Bacteroidota bacterium]|nr:FAD:protein transferase [Bacteroidota bacterium]